MAMLLALGSSYLCEKVFSDMKFILSLHRADIVDHSEHVFSSKYPNIPQNLRAEQGEAGTVSHFHSFSLFVRTGLGCC